MGTATSLLEIVVAAVAWLLAPRLKTLEISALDGDELLK